MPHFEGCIVGLSPSLCLFLSFVYVLVCASVYGIHVCMCVGLFVGGAERG